MKTPSKHIQREINKRHFFYFSYVEESLTIAGDWYWCIIVDGEIYADGDAGSKEEALERLRMNEDEYCIDTGNSLQ
jgi:hypothetical protein